ncbi:MULTISPECIES: hypothetical protein [Sphingobium]|jgi:hypothetical protein|uniref:hypothetical protein n=1 Tax=Sphingobium TaxID=165695 RepID=UPI000DBBAB7C|nr:MULTISPECIES: hypothetical protein [Sphingobium]KAA9016500.1 hypothetical protein F4U94_09315 [Sphingobium limneticum]BBC99466.1 hypothetical protein YGS_C1P0722 [Sphingobium sp. YG1]
MTGILSSTPAHGPIRLLVGTHLLLLVQTVLVCQASDPLPISMRIFQGMSGLLGFSALIVGVRGERQDQGKPWWAKRHGR